MDCRLQHPDEKNQSQAAKDTTLPHGHLNSPAVRAIRQHCERQEHADPWNHLMMLLTPEELDAIPSGYPSRLNLGITKPARPSRLGWSVTTTAEPSRLGLSVTTPAVPSHSSTMHDATLISDTSMTQTSSTMSVLSDNTSNGTLGTELPCRLWCEHWEVLGCDVEFAAEEQESWIEHHKKHLKYNYPEKLKCFLCGEAVFHVNTDEGRNYDRTFELRMLHIAEHITREYIQRTCHEPDPLMLDHMLDLGIITNVKDPRPSDRKIPNPDNELSSNSSGEARTESRICSDDNTGGCTHSGIWKSQVEDFTDVIHGATPPILIGIDTTRHGNVNQMASRNWGDFIKLDSEARLGDAGNWVPTYLDLISGDIFTYFMTPVSDVFDEFLFSFNSWLDWALTCQGGSPVVDNTCGRDGNHGNEGSDEEYQQTPKSSSTSASRKKGGGGGGHGGKKRRGEKLQPSDWIERGYFACPFLKHDPYGANRERCFKAWAPGNFHEVK